MKIFWLVNDKNSITSVMPRWLEYQKINHNLDINIIDKISRRNLKKNNFNLVHTHSNKTLIKYLLQNSLIEKNDHIHSFHYDMNRYNFFFKFIIYAIINFSNISSIIFTSKVNYNSIMLSKFIFRLKKKKIFYSPPIYPIEDLDQIFKKRKNYVYNKNKTIKFVICSRLVKLKRISNFLEMINHIKSNFDLQLDIFGDGNEKNFLYKKVTEYNLHKVVTFKGLVNYQEIYKNYSNYDFAVNLSYTEAYNMFIWESLNCGIPVINYNDLLVQHKISNFSINPNESLKNQSESLMNIIKSDYDINNVKNSCDVVVEDTSFKSLSYIYDKLSLMQK